MRFEMFTEHEVELFAMHINFFNLGSYHFLAHGGGGGAGGNGGIE